MVTSILLIVFAIIFGALFAQKKFKIIEKVSIPSPHGIGYLPTETLKVNYISIVSLVLALLFILFQPYSIKKIEAGFQGLLVNLVGDSRGASSIKEVSGWKFYNTWTEEIYQIPLDQRSIRYGKQPSVAKGGFPCTVDPSFNYSVKRGTTADMFTNLRTSFRNGNGLETVEAGWLEIAILGALNDVTNRWKIQDIFNDKTKYEYEVQVEVNKRVGKWFNVSQLRTNMPPPGSIAQSIQDKAAADYNVQKSQAQALAATADAERKIALAKGDSATVVIEASSVAQAMKLKKQELTPIYVEYIKWVNASNDVPRVPSTILGKDNPSIINLK